MTSVVDGDESPSTVDAGEALHQLEQKWVDGVGPRNTQEHTCIHWEGDSPYSLRGRQDTAVAGRSGADRGHLDHQLGYASATHLQIQMFVVVAVA